MDFRVYVIIEAPILDKKYELLVPIDRRIHDLVTTLKKAIPELNRGYYEKNIPNIYNKSTGDLYEINTIIKNSNIKMGTRLILL
jgi:hypothetical protein